MKRNMVPLVAIAVVVAIISTGVFYGLFAGKLRSASADVVGPAIVVAAHDLQRGNVLQETDLRVAHLKSALSGSFSNPHQLAGATLLASVKENEPLLEERVSSKSAPSGSVHGAVPAGQRAISIRVSESDSLMPVLKPGDKVDLQAVRDRNGTLELRTVLQNVEVLAVNPQSQSSGGNRGAVSIVTVLTRAEDADVVALADSGTRLRLALRNPTDEETERAGSLALNSLFQSNGSNATLPRVARNAVANAGADQRPIQLHLEVLRASRAAASQLESKLARAGSEDGLSVAAFQPGIDAGELVRGLQKQGGLESVLATTLTASAAHPTRFRTGSEDCQLLVHFSPVAGAGGKLSLRVRPEIGLHNAGGVESRVYEAELPASANFLVTGILNAAHDRSSLERLFPKQSWTDANLMIVISAQAAGDTQPSPLARTSRRR